MTNIELFNCGEIGLDFRNSSMNDIEKLSDYSVPYCGGRADVVTLLDYVNALMDTEYDIILFDNKYNSLNAYTGDLTVDYKKTHPVLTAGEILQGQITISETEINELFAG